MFRDCISLTKTPNLLAETLATACYYGMFYDCSSLTSLDLSSFDTSNVTNMGAMFDGCSSLTSVTFKSPDGWKIKGKLLGSFNLSKPIITTTRY